MSSIERIFKSWRRAVRVLRESQAGMKRGRSRRLSLCVESLEQRDLMTVTLGLGDIAFTGYQSTTTDKASFVLLKDVDAGTVLTVTDNAWTGSALTTNEGNSVLTFGGNFSAGTQLNYDSSRGIGGKWAVGSTTANLSDWTSGNFGLNASGDNLFAYNGSTAPTTGGSPLWISAFASNAFLTSGTQTTSLTYLPSAFAAGDTAFSLGIANGASNENGAETAPSSVNGTPAQIRGIVYTLANWATFTTAGGHPIPPNMTFTVGSGGSNSAPTGLGLASTSISENAGANAVVGTLSTTDPDAGNTFTYTLVSGSGSTDNASFNISGSSLRATNSLDFERKNSYGVRVRTTDQGGLWFEQAFTITVLDVNETGSTGTLRFVSYNVAASGNSGIPQTGLSTILQAIGTEIVSSVSRPIDLLAMQEVLSQATTSVTVAGLLNTAYSTVVYAASTLDGASTGSGTQGFVYNTQTIELLEEVAVGTASSSGQPRQTVRGKFRPVGTTGSSDFYVYNGHFKAADTTADEARRLVEAQVIRANADALGQGANILYVGDFNVYRGTDNAFEALIASGNGQAFDPVNRIGSWSGNSTYVDILTQAPANNPPNGLTGGGLDDRFDFQLVTGELLDGLGLDYRTGSYHTFGNNGSVPVNGNINSPSSTALSGLANRTTVLDLLTSVTDHLPVVADFTFTTAGTTNQAPTALALSPTTIAENAGANATVGTLTTTDPDAGNTSTYTLVSGTGSTDNADFSISGSALRAAASFNFETKSSYSVRVRTTDQGGLFFENTFTVSVTNVNEAPTIGTQTFSIAENSANGTAVGTVAAADVDAGDTKTFAITAGNTSGAFAINASTGAITVATTSALDFEATPSFSLTVSVTDAGSLSGSNTVTVNLTDVSEGNSLRVTSFAPTNTGFVANFNQPLVVSDLNLYGNAALGITDVSLVGSTVGAIHGSLILNAAGNQVIFVRTQTGGTAVSATGVLPNDTYSVTFRSASNGFRNATSGLLDGDGDGTAGDDYVTNFTKIVPTGAVTVSIPDFSRGHGQSVNVPNTASGLPLNISTGQNVSSLQLTLTYDSSLLSITGFILSNALVSAGVQATANTITPGQVILDITSTSEFSSNVGAIMLGTFTATVPTTAPYAGKHVLDITSLTVFDNDPGIPAERASVDDDAIHVAAYVGDTSGNRQIQTNDGTLLARVNALLDTGFVAYQLADPVIIADISGNNQIQSNDGTLLARFNALISTPQIPPVPAAPVPLPTLAIDPILAIGNARAAAGSTVTVPVTLAVPATELTIVGGITSFQLYISIDNTKLSFVTSTVFNLSESTAGFSVASNQITSGMTNTLIVNVESGANGMTPAIAPGGTMELGNLTISIPAGATGTANVNLLGSYNAVPTVVFDNRFRELLLLDAFGNPAPTNGIDPDNDGVISINGPPNVTPTHNVMSHATDDFEFKPARGYSGHVPTMNRNRQSVHKPIFITSSNVQRAPAVRAQELVVLQNSAKAKAVGTAFAFQPSRAVKGHTASRRPSQRGSATLLDAIAVDCVLMLDDLVTADRSVASSFP